MFLKQPSQPPLNSHGWKSELPALCLYRVPSLQDTYTHVKTGMCIKMVVLVGLWPVEGLSGGDTGGSVSVQHRYRRLEQPAEFGGRHCTGHLWDEQACQAETACTGPPGCGQDFQCEETGEWTRHKPLPQRVLVLGVSVPSPRQQEGEPVQGKAGKFPLFNVFPPPFTETHPCYSQIWVEKKAVWHGECGFFQWNKERRNILLQLLCSCSHSPRRARRSLNVPLPPLLETEFNHQSNQQSVGVI